MGARGFAEAGFEASCASKFPRRTTNSPLWGSAINAAGFLDWRQCRPATYQGHACTAEGILCAKLCFVHPGQRSGAELEEIAAGKQSKAEGMRGWALSGRELCRVLTISAIIYDPSPSSKLQAGSCMLSVALRHGALPRSITLLLFCTPPSSACR